VQTETLLNFKVIGRRSRSHRFFSGVRDAGYPRAVLSLEQGLVILLLLLLSLLLLLLSELYSTASTRCGKIK